MSKMIVEFYNENQLPAPHGSRAKFGRGLGPKPGPGAAPPPHNNNLNKRFLPPNDNPSNITAHEIIRSLKADLLASKGKLIESKRTLTEYKAETEKKMKELQKKFEQSEQKVAYQK
eukprot:UN11907